MFSCPSHGSPLVERPSVDRESSQRAIAGFQPGTEIIGIPENASPKAGKRAAVGRLAVCSTPDNKKTSCESPGSHLPRLLTPHGSHPTRLGVVRLAYIAIELVLEPFEGRERALVVPEERAVRTDLVAPTPRRRKLRVASYW